MADLKQLEERNNELAKKLEELESKIQQLEASKSVSSVPEPKSKNLCTFDFKFY